MNRRWSNRLPDSDAFVADIAELVQVESPTSDVAGCRAAAAVLAQQAGRALGRVAEVREIGGRPHLEVAAEGHTRVLLLGHIDTVWPVGTLDRWPLEVAGDVLCGPGVFDMKAGLVMGLHALHALGAPTSVAMLVTSDEETGAPTSRTRIEAAAAEADAVLVLEPAAPGGAVKRARKGLAGFQVRIAGRAAHAGLAPESGVNALLELAAQVPRVASLADPQGGTTVTPTVARAGTTINTVPAAAQFDVDVRAATVAELQRVTTAIHELQALQPGATVEVTDHGARPPLEPRMSQDLLDRWTRTSERMGMVVPGAVTVGGGSDGNLTAAIGVPTLDGLGAVGDGAHAEGEHLLLAPTREATIRLTALLEDLLA